MKWLKRLLLGIAAGGSLYVAALHILVSGGIVYAAARHLGLWSYPAFFGVNMFLASAVLLVLVPPYGQKSRFTVPWPQWLLPRIQRLTTLDEKKFQNGWWLWAHKRGAFALALAASVIVSPIAASLVLRYLRLSERRAWTYAFVTTLISTAVWISFYLFAADSVIRKL